MTDTPTTAAGGGLRECPLCNGRAALERWMPLGEGRIYCESCVLTLPLHAKWDDKLAIAAWNRRADRWMPIETAPTDGTVVLVYAPATDPAKWAIDLPEAICTAVYHEDAGWCICTVRDVTHWRPLPTPPAGDAP